MKTANQHSKKCKLAKCFVCDIDAVLAKHLTEMTPTGIRTIASMLDETKDDLLRAAKQMEYEEKKNATDSKR